MVMDSRELGQAIDAAVGELPLEQRIVAFLKAGPSAAADGGAAAVSGCRQTVVLDRGEREIVRAALAGHERMLMRGVAAPPVYARLVRLLMRVRDAVESRHEAGRPGLGAVLKLVNVAAYGLQALPGIVLPRVERFRVRWFPGDPAERRLRAAIYARRLPVHPLLKLAPGLPQSPSCYAYVNDVHRNVVVGSMIGVDVVRHGSHWTVIEANTGSGQNDQWVLKSERNPFIENLVEFARRHGFENLWVINNDRGLHPSQERHYREAAARTGVNVRIIEPSSIPVTGHPRSAVVPPLDVPNTLCVRIRDFPCWADTILSEKRQVVDTLNAYLARHGITDVATADSSEGWLDRVDWDSGRFPNVVAKIPDADKGIGIAFYKARSKAHALALISGQARSDFRIGGLQGMLARTAKSGERLLEAFVPSDLSPEGRLFKYRLNLLVTPVGHTMLSSVVVTAAKPVPAELEDGLVTDPYPYIANAFEGSLRRRPGGAELASLAVPAQVISQALAERLEHQFSLEPCR